LAGRKGGGWQVGRKEVGKEGREEVGSDRRGEVDSEG